VTSPVPEPSHEVRHPIIVLTLPRSYSSIVAAMIGCHPELYGLPELQLWEAESIGDWLRLCRSRYPGMSDGLNRAVAELVFGAQTERSVELAGGWIRRRAGSSVGRVVEELARSAAPRTLVEKSPAAVWDLASMNRALAMFPDARFIHLVRHPRGFSESAMRYFADLGGKGVAHTWLHDLVAFDPVDDATGPAPSGCDPQHAWYTLNHHILAFLEQVPAERRLLVRSEDVLTETDAELARIARWLGVRTDAQPLAAMKRPDLSPFAGFGPANAPYGNDINFLTAPHFTPPASLAAPSLDGPLPWRGDGADFAPAVVDQAHRLGYA
jgi:sulfotransferase family protein